MKFIDRIDNYLATASLFDICVAVIAVALVAGFVKMIIKD